MLLEQSYPGPPLRVQCVQLYLKKNLLKVKG